MIQPAVTTAGHRLGAYMDFLRLNTRGPGPDQRM